MKKFLLLFPCFALSVSLAQSQTQSGTSSSGQSGAQSGTSGQQPSGTTGQIDSQQTVQPGVTVPGAPGVIVNDPAGISQPPTAVPGGDTNRIPFGGTNQVPFGSTNQVPFGRTNPGSIINDPSGVNARPQVPFGTNLGSGAVQPPSLGAEIIHRDQAGNIIQQPQGVPGAGTNRVGAAQDALFAQQLNAALTRGGATRVFFPQTRSTITLVNQNGSILLQGSVSSETERQEIEARVKNSAGVTSVNNQLRVAPPAQNRAISPIPNTPPVNENERQLLNP